MPQTFTLDTNCLIDVADKRPAAKAVQALAGAHAAGRADVAVVAITASEKQRGGHYSQDFTEFRNRLVSLGLGHLKVILPMGYWDISFWDQCLWADEAMRELEHKIHSILFPTVPFLWKDYCRANSLDPPDPRPNPSTGKWGKWRNHKCDVQAIWSHIHHKRDVFVTSDTDFHDKKAALIALGAGRIEHPDGAISLPHKSFRRGRWMSPGTISAKQAAMLTPQLENAGRGSIFLPKKALISCCRKRF